MAFTDEDLKRYRSFHHGGPKSDGTWVVRLDELKALIARMEAAEEVCMADPKNLLEYLAAKHQWCKVAGKGDLLGVEESAKVMKRLRRKNAKKTRS